MLDSALTCDDDSLRGSASAGVSRTPADTPGDTLAGTPGHTPPATRWSSSRARRRLAATLAGTVTRLLCLLIARTDLRSHQRGQPGRRGPHVHADGGALPAARGTPPTDRASRRPGRTCPAWVSRSGSHTAPAGQVT